MQNFTNVKMQNSVSKFYKADQGDVRRVRSDIIKCLESSGEKNHMTAEDINALSRILAYRLQSGEDDHMCIYEHVVDFLWMSFHIEINTKTQLLKLVEVTA